MIRSKLAGPYRWGCGFDCGPDCFVRGCSDITDLCINPID